MASKNSPAPDPAEPNYLAAVEVSCHPAADLDVTLVAAIPRRRTDRQHYSSWSVPAADITLMEGASGTCRSDAAASRVPSKAAHIVARAVWQHTTDHD